MGTAARRPYGLSFFIRCPLWRSLLTEARRSMISTFGRKIRRERASNPPIIHHEEAALECDQCYVAKAIRGTEVIIAGLVEVLRPQARTVHSFQLYYIDTTPFSQSSEKVSQTPARAPAPYATETRNDHKMLKSRVFTHGRKRCRRERCRCGAFGGQVSTLCLILEAASRCE